MNFNLKTIANFDWKCIPSKLLGFLARLARPFLVILLLILVLFCIYIWYVYVYNFHWSDGQKTEYTKSHDKSVNFDAKSYDELTSDMENRKRIFDITKEEIPDIFRLQEKIIKQNNPG